MSDTVREDNTSDNEITMLDPFHSEDIQDVSSREDEVNNDVAKKRDTIFHSEILLNEPEEITLIDTLDEQDAPKSVEEEEGKENKEIYDDLEEITSVGGSNERKREEKEGEIDEITLEDNLNEKEKVEKEEAVEEDEITLVDFEEDASEERNEGELLLAPRSRDNDHMTIRKKKQRTKKVFCISCVDFYCAQFRSLTCSYDLFTCVTPGARQVEPAGVCAHAGLEQPRGDHWHIAVLYFLTIWATR